MATLKDNARIRRAAVASREWAKRKAEVQARLATMDEERRVLLGHLRAIENEEAKAAADSKGD